MIFQHLSCGWLMLEATAAELAAQNADSAAVASIRSALSAHTHARTIWDNADTDLVFHEAITRATGNPVIAVMFGSIRDFVHAIMLRSHSDPKVRQIGDPLHEVILECIAKRDAAGARAAMTEHLRIALDFYGADLDLPLADMLEHRGFDTSPLRDIEAKRTQRSAPMNTRQSKRRLS